MILSIIGALFKSNNHSVVGSVEDPPNGAAVGATVFGAVAVYAVCSRFLSLDSSSKAMDKETANVRILANVHGKTDIPHRLRFPGFPPHPR